MSCSRIARIASSRRSTMAVEQAAQRVLPAYEAPGAWRERIRAGLGALLEFLEDEPGMGALCVVDALGAGPGAIERRAQVVDALIGAVHEGRHEVRGGASSDADDRGGRRRRGPRGAARAADGSVEVRARRCRRAREARWSGALLGPADGDDRAPLPGPGRRGARGLAARAAAPPRARTPAAIRCASSTCA